MTVEKKKGRDSCATCKTADFCAVHDDKPCSVVCMQSPNEEEFWCKHDGSKHSCYCPVSLNESAEYQLQAIARLQAVAAEGALIELAERGFLECVTTPRCGNCTTCRASAIAHDLMAGEGT